MDRLPAKPETNKDNRRERGARSLPKACARLPGTPSTIAKPRRSKGWLAQLLPSPGTVTRQMSSSLSFSIFVFFVFAGSYYDSELTRCQQSSVAACHNFAAEAILVIQITLTARTHPCPKIPRVSSTATLAENTPVPRI